MPDLSWKWYETTRNRAYVRRPGTWQPVVEFDEHVILYRLPAGMDELAAAGAGADDMHRHRPPPETPR